MSVIFTFTSTRAVYTGRVDIIGGEDTIFGSCLDSIQTHDCTEIQPQKPTWPVLPRVYLGNPTIFFASSSHNL